MPSPTHPAPRIAYDSDGSFAFISRNVGSDRSPFAVQPDALQRLNADQFGGMAVTNAWWDITNPMPSAPHFVAIVFPTPMHIVAWFGSARSRFWTTIIAVTEYTDVGLDIEFQVSRDTTNGMDGTWTTMTYKDDLDFHLPFSSENSAVTPDDVSAGLNESNTFGDPQYKDASLEDTGWQYIFGPAKRRVQGIRLYFPLKPSTAGSNYAHTLLHLHLYGFPDDTATEDRLVFLDGTTEDPLTESISWGDIDYQDSETRSVKIQNLSTTLTSEGVDVTVTAGYPEGTPTSTSALMLSLDGTTWDDAVVIGDLAPEEISDEIFIRLDPEAGTHGLRFARVLAEVEDWT